MWFPPLGAAGRHSGAPECRGRERERSQTDGEGEDATHCGAYRTEPKITDTNQRGK